MATIMLTREALLYARNDPGYQDIEIWTKGIVFFGTPHRGFNGLSVNTLGKLLKTFKLSESLIELPSKDNHLLTEHSVDFGRQASRYGILSFYERHESKSRKKFSVARSRKPVSVEARDRI